MKLLKKKRLMVAALAVALGLAVYLNFYLTESPALSTGTDATQQKDDANLGDATFVGTGVSEPSEEASYFDEARIKRTAAREEALSIIQEVLDSAQASADAKAQATQRATAIARNMVSLYGMSDELGLMAPASIQNQYLDNQSYLDCSQETAAIIDKTVQKILNQCYADAKQLLESNRALLDEIAEYLLLKETITGEELMKFVGADKAKVETTVSADENDFAE